MKRVLLVGFDPATVDFSDPALPPGMAAEKIHAGIKLALADMTRRGWLAEHALFEALVNAIHRAAPQTAIAFNSRPEDSGAAAARCIET